MVFCFESGADGWGSAKRTRGTTALKEKVLVGLGGVVSAMVRLVDMPFRLIACAKHVVSPVITTPCTSSRETRLTDFAGRLWTSLATLCFAPFHLPEKSWRKVFPPPCSHNRCMLRRYVSPRTPWYHTFKQLLQRLVEGPQQSQPPFPFFRLPLELRNLVYLHASLGNTTHDIQVVPPGRAGRHTRRLDRTEAATTYPLDDNGIIAMHGAVPPRNLLLVNKQMYEEITELFWSTTAFEVQPLTPNDACWRLDQSLQPTYEAIAKSNFATRLRKMRVRIHIARFAMGRQCKRFEHVNAQVCTFEEIGLAECVERLTPLAEELSKVLKETAATLRVVEVTWVDDFADDIGEDDLQLRAKVLEPYTTLEGVRVRLFKTAIAEQGRGAVMMMARQSLARQ
ncbi:hypothetical protein EK21DRAFT_86220 [Setomelanomma holmii]|uniref:Uncharacterized protein n=1 Tax=Setomelanomma holmii TaxID=210430 RepID=A0A9P4HI18_9PLEO|nr:hypothetical protein EK21DRAFT_86220 [Setomelanomma holmii]